MSDLAKMKTDVVEILGQKGVIRNKHVQIDTVVNWFPSHEQGDVKDAIDELLAEPDSPVIRKRQNTIRLKDASEAREYLRENGRDVPFRLRD